MKNTEISGELRIAIEKGIHFYFESRRQKVAAFVENHFSMQEALMLQKKFFATDLVLYPANALWTIPYLSLKQSFESLNKMGWRRFSPLMNHLPTGIRTNYQKQIEKFIVSELLEIPKDGKSNELIKCIQSQYSGPTEDINLEKVLKFQVHLKEKLEKYTSNRRFVADVAGNLATMATGWLFFGNHGLSISAIGQKIAGNFAKEKAASNFFLGKSLGKSYYQLFPPQPTKTQVFVATVVIGILFTAVSVVSGMLSDPLRKKMGMQEGNLQDFLNDLENGLLLEASHYFKSHHLNSNSPSLKNQNFKKSA